MQVAAAVAAKTLITPSQIYLNDTTHAAYSQTIKVQNLNTYSVFYIISTDTAVTLAVYDNVRIMFFSLKSAITMISDSSSTLIFREVISFLRSLPQPLTQREPCVSPRFEFRLQAERARAYRLPSCLLCFLPLMPPSFPCSLAGSQSPNKL